MKNWCLVIFLKRDLKQNFFHTDGVLVLIFPTE